jgi:hypothetical protein
MIISGWGIFLIFATNQAAAQILTLYPPFKLATITVLNISAYLILLRIYNSAKLIPANTNLRKTIQKHALELNLLWLIGQAEMEKEIEKTVKEITQDAQDKGNLETDTEQQPIEMDEKELKKYVELVIREVRKVRQY